MDITIICVIGVGIGYIGLRKIIRNVIWRKTLKDMIYKNRFKINQKNIKIYDLEERICCICLDNFHVKCENHIECDKRCHQLHCNHFFHKKCISKWLKTKAKCPLCNIDVSIKYTKKTYEQFQSEIRYSRNIERRRRIRNNRIHQSRN